MVEADNPFKSFADGGCNLIWRLVDVDLSRHHRSNMSSAADLRVMGFVDPETNRFYQNALREARQTLLRDKARCVESVRLHPSCFAWQSEFYTRRSAILKSGAYSGTVMRAADIKSFTASA